MPSTLHAILLPQQRSIPYTWVLVDWFPKPFTDRQVTGNQWRDNRLLGTVGPVLGLTSCVVLGREGARSRKMGRLGRVDNGFVNQHDWNVVPNRINTATLAALQALSFILESEGFLANWANQHIEQILRNHDLAMLTPGRQREVRILYPAG